MESRWAVVVSRNWVGDQRGVAVRIHHTHGRDVHLRRIPDGQMRLKDIVQCVQEDEEVGQTDTNSILDRRIGQQATLPVAGVGIFATLLSSGLHQMGALAMAADKQNDAFAVGNVGDEVEGQLEVRLCLLQVKDILIKTATEDVRLH